MLKSTSQDKVTLNSEKIRPVALAVNELCLSEGIRPLVNCIELKKKKFCSNLLEAFRVTLN